MEILSQSTSWTPYVIAMLILSIALVALIYVFIGGVIMLFTDFNGFDFTLTLIFGVLSTAMMFTVIGGLHQGPTTYYKATVTDYNVIYEAGYEIYSTDGKIVTLTKE